MKTKGVCGSLWWCSRAGFWVISGLLSFSLSFPASADVYPWVKVHQNDLVMIDNAKIEAQLRLELIRKAKDSLDIVAFDQRMDLSLGAPLIQALREAADRGVKVRYLVSWLGIFLKDPLGKMKKALSEPPTKVLIEFKIVGGIPMWRRGWGILDGIHEKLFIMDQRILLMTGRGHDGEYLKWLDTCFAIKGALVSQSINAFEKLWDSVTREMSSPDLLMASAETILKAEDAIKKMKPMLLEEPPSPIPSDEEQEQINKHLHWSSQPAVISEQTQGKSFYNARLLHHDLLDQLRKHSKEQKTSPSKLNWEWRTEHLYDPIVEEMIELSRTVLDYRYFTLATNMNPKFKSALVERLQKGLPVSIFTNGKEVHRQIFPLKGAVGWYAGLTDLDQLLSERATAHGLLYRANQIPTFLHRKIAVLGDTVIFGSHNFNISSSVESDEMSVEVQGASFAQRIRTLFDEDSALHTEVLDPKIVHEDYIRSPFERWISSSFSGYY